MESKRFQYNMVEGDGSYAYVVRDKLTKEVVSLNEIYEEQMIFGSEDVGRVPLEVGISNRVAGYVENGVVQVYDHVLKRGCE